MHNIDDSIIKELRLYCKINDIDDFDAFLNKIITIGFNIEKYGVKPNLDVEKIEAQKNIEVTKPTSEQNLTEVVKIKSNDDYGVYDL